MARKGEAEEPEAVKKLREITQMFEVLRKVPPPIKTEEEEKKSGGK